MEMDIIENNGNCAMATTWHTCSEKILHGEDLKCASNGDCNDGGCDGHMKLPGGPFRMRAEFAEDGTMTVTLNGSIVNVNLPSSSPKEKVVQVMASKGAMFHSTQWQGWVPEGTSCPTGGNLASSQFSVSNVTVYGTVVQGKEPQKCSV